MDYKQGLVAASQCTLVNQVKSSDCPAFVDTGKAKEN
jgi:hypothetical protein